MVKHKIEVSKINTESKFNGWMKIVRIDFTRNKAVYLLFLPILIYYIVFNYIPMYGVLMSFQHYTPGLGMFRSPWVGFDNFVSFFNSAYFFRLIRNTVLLSVYSILWGFPAPIILALLLNEVRNKFYKKAIQTITYIPNFISLVVIVGIMKLMLQREGIINYIISFLGIKPTDFLNMQQWFRTIYISSDIWTGVGFGAIIYLASLASLGNEIYEAAVIDGAGRWKQLIHLTIPGLIPTVSIMLIFSLGGMFGMGADKILLLYNPLTYGTADVISTYVYRRGIIGSDYSFAAAIGLFNSVINFILLIVVNKIAKSISEYSLW